MNSAFLMRSRPVKEKIQRYDKIRLLPFSEYMPLKETVAWSYLQIPEVGGFVPGKDLVIFKMPSYRFGVTIVNSISTAAGRCTSWKSRPTWEMQ